MHTGTRYAYRSAGSRLLDGLVLWAKACGWALLCWAAAIVILA